MDHLIYLYAAVVVTGTGLAFIAIWAPRALMLKVSALILAGLLMLTGYAGLVELLGRPKPASMEWAQAAVPEATVLGARLKEGEAIYLWLEWDGGSEPRGYVLPWRRPAAEALQRAMREAEADGTRVRMSRPFERDRPQHEAMFYAEPQPARPPKRPGAG